MGLFWKRLNGLFWREADMRPALSSSSRALIPRARHFCLFADAIHWCVRAVPHTKSADKGIGIVASLASFRQLIQAHEISAADDYILGFGGRDQSFTSFASFRQRF